MPFDKLEARIGSGRGGLPASISLRGKNSRPSFIIAFRAAFAAQLGKITERDRFDLLIGTGEHKGVCRIKRNAKGPLRPRLAKGGSVCIDCGYIERFGTEPEPKAFVMAEIIDADTVEVTLPAWGAEVEG